MVSYQDIFKTAQIKDADSLKSFKEGRIRMNERIVPATRKLLNDQMEAYPDIRELLTTSPLKLNPLYKNLVDESFYDSHKERNLFDMIDIPLGRREWKNLFSMVDDKICGFITYEVVMDYVNEIKMFSFSIDHSLVLLRDLDLLLDDLRKGYKNIHWGALKKNRIGNKIYQKAIKKYKGVSFETGENGGDTRIDYFVPGVEPLPREILDLAQISYVKD